MKTSRFIAVLFLAAVGLCVFALHSLWTAYAGFHGEVQLEIPRGAGTRGIARQLEEAGVIRHRWQLLVARALRPAATLQAGEYRFREPASVWEILERLARGDVVVHALAVPEGYNLFDIAASLDRLGVLSGEEFLQAARDASLIRDLAPQARTLEGYLFPDTYRVTRHMTGAELCGRMTERFRRAWSELGADSPVHETVTLASLVEKETAIAQERPWIASVFRNRLRIDMKLDCDPTAIYAALLEHRYRGTIYQSDLESTNRFNTYQNAGLPPGPIANPGMESLRAAIAPAATDYLYFVAKPDGSGAHVFSRGLEEHSRAVARYRRGNHQNKQASTAPRIPRREAAKPHPRSRVGGTRQASRAGV